MRLTIAIVAHQHRRRMAEELAATVGAELVVWDSGDGARETHERAWREVGESVDSTDDSHWGMVIEDDARPIGEFRRCMTEALNWAPSSVVSAYLGRGRPAQWQHSIAKVMANPDADWLVTRHVLSGVGLAVRADRIPDLIEYTQPSRTHQHPAAIKHRWEEPMDEAMSHWVEHRGLPVAYTHPSLLDHDPDLPSLIGLHRPRTHQVRVPEILGAHLDPDHRKAWWWAKKERWNNVCAMIPPPPS